MRQGIKTLLGAALIVGSLAACGDPLNKDREVGVFMFTDPTTATMKIDTIGIQVTARVMNRYDAPTGDAITGTPCNANITAVADPLRTALEAPERFIVKATASGTSCLVVQGGGLTDTVKILVQ